MTHKLSRREQKAIAKATSKKKPMITVDTKGMKDGIAYAIANLVAVFVFPFWLMVQEFEEWREKRRLKDEAC